MRLNRDIRYQIKALLEAGLLQKDIANQLKITPGALTKELQRNGGRDEYDPDKAVKKDWSPDEIVGRRKNEGLVTPSVSTIYRWLKNKPELEPHLRHLGKSYRKRGQAKDTRGSIRDQQWIDDRPPIVDRKVRFGDFEIDLINGAHHKGNLFTANDRMSGFCILEPLKTKEASDLANTMISAFKPYKRLLHTVTSDNGKEFAEHVRIAEELKVGYYFAHPYHSWERGANENMNGLIRQYLPKGTSFEDLTREEVKWIEWKLNNRPRKRLGYLTPLEYISRQVKQIYLAT